MKIHLICGPSGAGKTTQARKIAQATQAIPLLIDECLRPLSIPDAPDSDYRQKVLSKAMQCAGKILKQAEQLLTQNKEVVLDIATFRRIDRDFIRDWARKINVPLIMYYVYAKRTTRWNRVMNRNEQRGDTHSFNIPLWWFDFAESVFEPPSDHEFAILIDNDNDEPSSART